MKILIGAAMSLLTLNVSAALIDRGAGMVYDEDLDITWLADANYALTSGYDADGLMTAQESQIWADQLVFGGYDDWRLTQRLPTATGPYCDASYDCDDTEFAHLYYSELDGVTQGPVGTVRNVRIGDYGPFINIQQQYWSGIIFDADHTGNFHFDGGYQIQHPIDNPFAAWAVRNGDVSAVPVPAAAWLFGSGLISLIGIARRKKS